MSLDDQRRRWRKYNRSERGKARYRRWRQSPRGKARLQEKYQARTGFLDEAKSRAGCEECGERDPRVLAFVPRPSQEVKFPPRLENVTRSFSDWKEVIAACDVICRNCLAKKRRGEKPETVRAGGQARARRLPLIRPKPSVNATLGHVCEVCGVEIKAVDKGPKSKPRKRFCSDRCRLLHWAARELERLEIKP